MRIEYRNPENLLEIIISKTLWLWTAVNEGPFSFTLKISSKKESQSRIDSLLCTGGSNTISPSLLFYVGKIYIFKNLPSTVLSVICALTHFYNSLLT